MKLKSVLKVALALFAICSLFVACDTLAGGVFPVMYESEPGKLYLLPSGNWAKGDEAYACWFWANGGEGSWTLMTAKESDPYTDGLYEVTIPEGVDNVIFVRYDKTKEISWDAKWDQTADLKIPTDDAVLYDVSQGKFVASATGNEEPEAPVDPDPEDPVEPEDPVLVVTPESSTGVWSYTLPLSEISSAWGGKPEKAVFMIMLMTDEEVAAGKHSDDFKIQSANIEIHTHAAGNFSIKGLEGVAATVTATDLTVFVDGAKINLAEGKKPYVLALASKANAEEDFCFADWGETMKMTPDATYPTDLVENAAPAGEPQGYYKLTHVAGDMTGWSHVELDENNSITYESDGSEKGFKFTAGGWDYCIGATKIDNVGEFELGNLPGADNGVIALPAGTYKITLVVEAEDSAKVVVTKL